MYWPLAITRVACLYIVQASYAGIASGQARHMAVAAIVGEPDRCQSCGEDIDEHTPATIT